MKHNQEIINEHIANVVSWAHARNLIGGSNPAAQFLKLMEERGELHTAEGEMNMGISPTAHQFLDAIGDTAVVLIVIAAQEGVVWRMPLIDGDTRASLDFTLTQLAVALQDRSDNRADAVAFAVWAALNALHMSAWSHGWGLGDCLAAAWEEIKDRRGRMVDGIFVKEEDLEEGQ